MLLVYGFAGLGFVIGVIAALDDNYNPNFPSSVATKSFRLIGFVVLGAIIGGAFGGCSSSLAANGMPTELKLEKTISIVSMKDRYSVQGSHSGTFLYSSGSISESYDYTYFTKSSDGGIRHHTITGNAIIYEDTKSGGYIEFYESYVVRGTNWDLFTMPFWINKEDRYGYERIEIHIPPDSVQLEYAIDDN